MPKENLQWKVSDAKRLLRAMKKEGFANRRMSLSARKDGTLTIEVTAPSPAEVSLDVSR
jgi:DNA-binding MarR family transcriptional regulator